MDTHLGNKDEPHCKEAGEEDGYGNKGKTSVLVGANDESDWSRDQTQHLQHQQTVLKHNNFVTNTKLFTALKSIK